MTFTTLPVYSAPSSAVGGSRISSIRRRASSTAAPSFEPMLTVPTTPSSLTDTSAPVSWVIVLMTLPLGPITSPILSIGISKLMIFGAVSLDVVAGRRRSSASITSRIFMRASRAWSSACAQHVGGEAVDLGVELQRGDEVARAGDLEVHVAERVLGAEDVGEGRVLALGVDEAHRDAGDRRLERHAAVEHRERGTAHRRHRGGAVRAEHVGDDAQHVGPLLLRRDHGQQRPLGERAVADLAALRRTRRGRSHRWSRAGSCSGGCSAWWCRAARRGR